MRKITQSKSAIDNQCTEDHTLEDGRPRRIQGATITSWNGPPRVDLEALFDRSTGGPTVTGAARTVPDRPVSETVALPDGSRITFVSADQFKSVLTT
jgi:hypothetical protein